MLPAYTYYVYYGLAFGLLWEPVMKNSVWGGPGGGGGAGGISPRPSSFSRVSDQVFSFDATPFPLGKQQYSK